MKRLNGSLDVKFINRTFFREYKDVSVINQGECFLWAYHAYRLYKNIELWHMDAHAFVRSKDTGLFYDSERPDGVENWEDLPATNFGQGCGCFKCQRPPRKFKTAGKFRRSWTGCAERFNVKWDKVHAKIKRIIKEQT